MRHLAWLHAIPEGSKQSRLEQFKLIDENHPALTLPDVEEEHAAGYLIALLHEAGLMSTNGMGPVPISWLEIKSWLDVTKTEVGVWELTTLKILSETYVSERIEATDVNRPRPYKPALEVEREATSNKIYNLLSKFIKKTDE